MSFRRHDLGQTLDMHCGRDLSNKLITKEFFEKSKMGQDNGSNGYKLSCVTIGRYAEN